MSEEKRLRVEQTDLPNTVDIKNRHRLVGDVPLTDEEMVERFRKSLALAREQRVRVVITAFELDPSVPPRAVTWFSGTPRTMYGSALIGMVELLNLLLVESGNNKGEAMGIFRQLARLAIAAYQAEGRP
jgi:hypothetical protein